jgi:hypothetical protein
MSALNQIGHETLTVAATAVGLTPPAGKRPKHALIKVNTGDIRWRADGTDPTDTVGVVVAAGGFIDWTDPSEYSDYWGLISRVRFIRDTATSAELDIAYFD